MKHLKSTERKKLFRELDNLFGVSSVSESVVKVNKEQFNIFTGNLNKELLGELVKAVRVEAIGLPIIEKKNNEVKLTFDSLNVLKPDRLILEIDKENYEKWIRGHDIEIDSWDGLVLLKYGEDFVGIAKSQNGKIFNSVPKDRRVKDMVMK